ncbi:hypothetical protein STENM223S_07647 [Streptomyces tendae]
MASHRRPKQPSNGYASVLTATAAVSVALSASPASADPLPRSEQEGRAGADRPPPRGGDPGHGEVQRGEGERGEAPQGGGQPPGGRGPQAGRPQRAAPRAGSGGRRTAAACRSGGIDPSVRLLLSSDPDAYLDEAAVLDRLGARQSQALHRFLSEQRALQQQRTQAGAKLADLQDTRKELGDRKKEIQGKLAEAQRLLNTLTAKERAAIAARLAARGLRGVRRASCCSSTASSSSRTGAWGRWARSRAGATASRSPRTATSRRASPPTSSWCPRASRARSAAAAASVVHQLVGGIHRRCYISGADRSPSCRTDRQVRPDHLGGPGEPPARHPDDGRGAELQPPVAAGFPRAAPGRRRGRPRRTPGRWAPRPSRGYWKALQRIRERPQT